MKKLIYILFIAPVFYLSCNDAAKQAESAEQVPVTRKELNSEVNKTVAHLTIEGMTCSAGCGGKIQQDLRAENGVSTTMLDYEEGRSTNVVTVEYDPAKVNEQQLIQCVQRIADNKYKVKSVEVITYHGLQTSAATSPVIIEVDLFSRFFQVLNLLSSAVNLIH